MCLTQQATFVQEGVPSELHPLYLIFMIPLQVDVFAHRLHVQNFELKNDGNSKQNGVC